MKDLESVSKFYQYSIKEQERLINKILKNLLTVEHKGHTYIPSISREQANHITHSIYENGIAYLPKIQIDLEYSKYSNDDLTKHLGFIYTYCIITKENIDNEEIYND